MSKVEKMASRVWGIPLDELATRETSYRSDLFAGKVVVISGGGSGMGRAAAFLFARLGARVLICGRDAEKLDRAAEAIRTLVGVEIATHALSIRDEEAVDAMAQVCFDRFGRVDHLINSAGGQFPQEALALKPKGWRAVVDTNLNGTWWMMQAFARRWSERGEPGNIVNIVAVIDRGIPHSAHTAAARAGVVHLTKSVAVEWAPIDIRVNCIAPGTIETEGFNNYPPEYLDRLGKGNAMRRLGDVWDVAESMAYLCAPSAKFITGEFLHVDGGMQLWGTNWPLGVPEYYRES